MKPGAAKLLAGIVSQCVSWCYLLPLVSILTLTVIFLGLPLICKTLAMPSNWFNRRNKAARPAVD